VGSNPTAPPRETLQNAENHEGLSAKLRPFDSNPTLTHTGFRKIRLAWPSSSGPGVTLHEAAHYLACLLTGTRVSHFVPFWPQRSASDHLLLGYVRHERRPFPVEAVIGLAPILLDPLGILVVTALLTPLTLAQVTDPRFEVVNEVILTSGFIMGSPHVAATWIYLSLSFALGSVPNRADLSSVPVALLFFGGGLLLVGFLGGGFESTPTVALYDPSALAVRVYSLPATVAVAAAVTTALWGRQAGY
jgi:hypothetical protein